MGRIFSYEEIAEGRLPTPETFTNTHQVFSELAHEGIQDGWLDGAFVYGSVALGLANPRSDFDAFLALTDSTLEVFVAAKQLISETLDSCNRTIPMAPNVQPVRALEAGRHEMDRFFGKHLCGDNRIVYGNDPASYISFAPLPADQILADYIFHKRRRLTDAYTATSPHDASEDSGIQRLLELPTSIGRKLLPALEEVGIIGEQPEMGAHKKAVQARTRTLLASENLEEGFDQLLEFDQLYSDLLHAASQGSVSKEAYDDEIHGLHSGIPVAITWLSKLEESLLVKLDPNTERSQVHQHQLTLT